jgi:hypothetical protein
MALLQLCALALAVQMEAAIHNDGRADINALANGA